MSHVVIAVTSFCFCDLQKSDSVIDPFWQPDESDLEFSEV